MSYKTDAEIQNVVTDFETCRTGKDDFHHQQHIVVAICYLQTLKIEDATDRLRKSLLRFLDYHEIDRQIYNETVTVFWLEMVELELRRLPTGWALVDKCNSVVTALANSKLASEFYSSELISSDEARESFVEPDLKSWKA